MVATSRAAQFGSVLLAALVLLTGGCNQPPEPPRAVSMSAPPQVVSPIQTVLAVTAVPRSWIDAPLHGSTVVMGVVQVVSHSTHSEGLSLVELSVDGVVISSEENANPKQTLVTTRQTWKPAAAGKHTITLRAKTAAGIWGPQASVEVTVVAVEALRVTPSLPRPAGTTVVPSATPTSAPTPGFAERATEIVAPTTETTREVPITRLPTDTPAPTVVPTNTLAPTDVPTGTPVPVPTATATPTSRRADTATPTSTPTRVPPTYTSTVTATPTNRPILIFTPIPRLLPSPTPPRPTIPPIR